MERLFRISLLKIIPAYIRTFESTLATEGIFGALVVFVIAICTTSL